LNFVLLLIYKLIFCYSFFNVNDKMKTTGNIKLHDIENRIRSSTKEMS